MLLLLLLLVGGLTSPAESSPDVLRILDDMRDAYSNIRDYTVRLVKRERIGGRLRNPEELLLKFREPGQIYMRWVGRERSGREIIFVMGRDQDRALIHEPKFPKSLVTILVAPDSPLVLQESRHPITDVGLGRLIELLTIHARRAATRGELETRECPPVKSSSPGSAKAQRQIELITPKAATGYAAHRVVVTIDPITRLPVAADIFGPGDALLESYAYSDLVVNTGLTDLDFDPTNPQYTFPETRYPA
jgi:outer membrane lipoprotein-sorting protein